MVYDSDNRMVASPGGSLGTVETYEYAPDNRRVVQRTGTGAATVTLWMGSERAATANTDYILFAGRRFKAPLGADPVAEGADRLGSTGDHRPYGENATGKFATYERDSRTGLDYADQRYYQPGAGRFMTADRYLASGGAEWPGSWNRYAYVEGDPVNWVDPWGLAMADPLHYALMAPPDPVTGHGGGIAWMPEFTPTGFDMLPGTTIPGSILDPIPGGGGASSIDTPYPAPGWDPYLHGYSSAEALRMPRLGCRAHPYICVVSSAISIGIYLGGWIYQASRPRSQAGQASDISWAEERLRRECGTNLSPGQLRRVRDQITGQDLSREEVLDIMKDVAGFNRSQDEQP